MLEETHTFLFSLGAILCIECGSSVPKLADLQSRVFPPEASCAALNSACYTRNMTTCSDDRKFHASS